MSTVFYNLFACCSFEKSSFEFWMSCVISEICCQVIWRTLDKTININMQSLHFCSNSRHYPYNDICSTSLKRFYPCTGLIFPNTAALLSVFWKRALMRPLTSCAVNSWAKGPWGKYRYKSCFSIKWSFWQEQIPLKKKKRSWQVPFRLPIYPRCLVN